MQMPELLGRLSSELHVTDHALREQPAEAFFVGESAARPRCKGEDRTALVEHDNGADAWRLAARGWKPALGDRLNPRWVGDRHHDIVLIDDLPVESVSLLGREGECRFEDGLLAEAVDLERRAKSEVREHAHRDDDGGQEHEYLEAI